MADRNNPGSVNQKKRNRKGKKKGQAKPNKEVVKAMPRKNLATRKRKNPVKRTIVSDAESHVRGLVTSLLGTFDMASSQSMGEGVRVPRINSRPVAARKIPFSYKIPSTDFANNKLQVRFAPDPYRLLQHTVDNGASTTVHPTGDGVWQDLQVNTEQDIDLCLDPNMADDTGHMLRFDKVAVANGIDYKTLIGGGHNVQDGAAAMTFESINISSGTPWNPEATNYSNSDVTVVATITALGQDAPAGRAVLHQITSISVDLGARSGQTSIVPFVASAFTTFANNVNADASVKALMFSWHIHGRDGVITVAPGIVLGFSWANTPPLITSPTRWKTLTIFDILGEAGAVLAQEIDGVTKGACTQANLRFTDFVANLNKNGVISATQVPASSLKLFPSDVEKCIQTIENLGIPEYSWKSHPEPEGLSYVTHFDNPSNWERRPSKFLISRDNNLDDIDIPVMILAADFNAGVSPTPHTIKLLGSINYEWETTSLAFDLKFPPSNFTRFNEAYFQAITRECPFTENPVHLKEIAKKIENVMKHPLTKFVVKTIGEVGLAAVLSM